MDNNELDSKVSNLLRVGRLVEAKQLIEDELDARSPASPDEMQSIVSLYNALGLPRVERLTDVRKRALRARMKSHPDYDWWEKFFARVSRSPFLMGKTSTWRATFDWLMNPRNLQKVIEGNYDPPRSSGLSESEEAAFRMSRVG